MHVFRLPLPDVCAGGIEDAFVVAFQQALSGDGSQFRQQRLIVEISLQVGLLVRRCDRIGAEQKSIGKTVNQFRSFLDRLGRFCEVLRSFVLGNVKTEVAQVGVVKGTLHHS